MSNSALEKVKGLVISLNQDAKGDGAVRLLTPEGVESVRARGIFKPESKNRRLCIPGSLIEIDYDPRYSGRSLYLIHGTMIKAAPDQGNSLQINALEGFVADLVEKNAPLSNAYEIMNDFYQDLRDKNESAAYLDAGRLLAAVIYDQGLMPMLEGCSVCGKTSKIAGISFENGGLVCREHLTESDRKLNKERLLKFIAAFKTDQNNRSRVLQKYAFDADDVLLLADFLNYNQSNRSPAEKFFREIVEKFSKPKTPDQAG